MSFNIEDLPIKEIAGILGKSEGGVRVSIHRAIKAIRKELNKNNSALGGIGGVEES